MSIPIIILNLERSENRKNLLEQQLKDSNINYYFFPAFDGKDITNTSVYGNIIFGSGRGRPFNPAEIAITNGHLSIIKSSQSLGKKEIIILEDDVVICDDWNKRIEWILENLPNDWEYCYLAGHSDYTRIPMYEHNAIIHAPKMVGAFAYMVHERAYSKIAKYCSSYKTTYDDMIMHMIHTDKILKGYLALPFLTYHNANESLIWQENSEEYIKNEGDRHSSYKYFRKNIS